MTKDMKYNSNYESVQNCTPDTVLLHNSLNGKCSNLDMNEDNTEQLYANEVTKSIISLNGDDNKKIITRKTCTCSSGMVPCPSHVGTDRSSINGYANANSFTQLKCAKIQSKSDLKQIITYENEMAENNCIPLQNGTTTRTKTTTTKNINKNVKSKDKDSLNKNNKKSSPTQTLMQQQLEDTLSSSRTYTIESTPCHLNNSDNSNKKDLSVNSNFDELRLSLTSLISKDTITPDEKKATESFQTWLAEKKRQEREIRQRESNLQQLLKQERQKKLQMEQENFINWLHVKKQKEKEEKESKKKALQEEQRRKNEKLKREEINKKQYQLWLKLKEEQDLVKKINEQKRKIEKEEREQQRLAMNQSAFQEWLISSKDKPKPVPLNRGLESLRTSRSVAFVNPAPWVPNIVEKTKAKSK